MTTDFMIVKENSQSGVFYGSVSQAVDAATKEIKQRGGTYEVWQRVKVLEPCVRERGFLEERR